MRVFGDNDRVFVAQQVRVLVGQAERRGRFGHQDLVTLADGVDQDPDVPSRDLSGRGDVAHRDAIHAAADLARRDEQPDAVVTQHLRQRQTDLRFVVVGVMIDEVTHLQPARRVGPGPTPTGGVFEERLGRQRRQPPGGGQPDGPLQHEPRGRRSHQPIRQPRRDAAQPRHAVDAADEAVGDRLPARGDVLGFDLTDDLRDVDRRRTIQPALVTIKTQVRDRPGVIGR